MVRDAVTQSDAKAGKMVNAETQARLHADVDAQRRPELVRIEVKAGDTLRSLGRQLHRRHNNHDMDDQELKVFVADAASRNGLKTKDQQDNLHPGQSLVLRVPPAHAAGENVQVRAAAQSAEAPHTAAARRSEAPPAKPAEAAATHVVAAAPPREVHKPIPAAAPARREFACSGTAAEVNQIAMWITHNEAGPKQYTAFNPNDVGHGVSVGLMQWNQKRGKLPDLIEAWHDKNPAKFNRMFGSYSDELLSVSWVRSADFNSGTLTNGLKAALADPEFQAVQLQMRNGHIERSCEIAKAHGFKSVRGRAVIADLANQIGESGAARAASRVPANPNESIRIEQLKDRTDGRINGTHRVGAIEEKVKEIWRRQGS